MSDTKYRKKFFAILEGYGMDQLDQYELFGGIVRELQHESNVKIARMRDKVLSAERVLRASNELEKAVAALAIDLETEESDGNG